MTAFLMRINYFIENTIEMLKLQFELIFYNFIGVWKEYYQYEFGLYCR